MRILHVIPGLSYSSGPTHIVLRICDELRKQGCEVAIYYLTGRGLDTVTPGDRSIELRGFPIKGPARYGYSPELQRCLFENAGSFDVIHSHSLWMFPNLALSRASRRSGTPYIIAPQGTLDTWSLRQNSLLKQLYGTCVERSVLNRAAAIQAVSGHEVQNVREYGVSAPVFVIPNGVDPEAIKPSSNTRAARELFDIAADRDVVLYLSRLHPKKGIDTLIAAFSVIAAALPRAVLLIAGSDGGSGYRQEVWQMVEALSLREKVIFAGEVKEERKTAAFHAADVFALTTHSEGLPVAALEAMAAGVPVLLTPGCRIPEAAEFGAGRVVEKDRDAVAEELIEMLRDRDGLKEMGDKARQLAEERFSWEAVTARLLGQYRELTGGACEQRESERE
jgi:poly(glycerol-phosphate) alpha-glucosyltransferase